MEKIQHSTSDKGRIHWIDTLKVLAIFFVVWGHFADGNDLIVKTIYAFHMPLFFMISGYLYLQRHETYINCINRNARSLLLPYIVFAGLLTFFRMSYSLYINNYSNAAEHLFIFITGDTAWYLTGLFLLRVIFNKLSNKMLGGGIYFGLYIINKY